LVMFLETYGLNEILGNRRYLDGKGI
jgi:hypothetical protein